MAPIFVQASMKLQYEHFPLTQISGSGIIRWSMGTFPGGLITILLQHAKVEAQLSQLEESKGSRPVCDLGEFSRDYRHTYFMEHKNLENTRETERR